MSMYSRQKTVELHVATFTKDKRSGNMVPTYEKILKINADINFSTMALKIDGERFKDCEYVGTTDYKDFDLSKDYKLVYGNITYEIKSINTVSRRTQLILRRVVDTSG